MRTRKLMLAILALALLTGCSARENGASVAPTLLEPVQVKTDAAPVTREDVVKMNVYDAYVTPYVEALEFTVDGVVEQVCVIPGQLVEKGDTLIVLDESDMRERHDELEGQIAYQRSVYECDYALLELEIEGMRLDLTALEASPEGQSQAIALKQADIEAKRTALRQRKELDELALAADEQTLSELAEKLGKNTLVAPFSGRVLYGPYVVKDGYVSAYDPVLFLADDSRVELTCEYVSESYMNAAKSIVARIGATDYAITAVVMDRAEYVRKLLAGEEANSVFTFDEPATFDCGTYAAICVVTARADGVLTVPVNALFRNTEGRYVYIVHEDGTRELRQVKVGLTGASRAEITEGVSEGESVYVKD